MACSSTENDFLCTGCNNTILSFAALSDNIEKLDNFLFEHGVIPRTKKCPSCGNNMTLSKSENAFRCFNVTVTTDSHKKKIKKKCLKYVSQYKNTWFENHNLSKQTICRFVVLWTLVKPPRHQLLQNELQLSDHSVVDWSNYLREVCCVVFAEQSQMIGGPGKIVEIDEAKVGKRKYNRGRVIQGNWVFGGIERGSNDCFLVPVATRGHEELLPLIKKYVRPGTTVISDCWRTYNCLQFEGFIHLTVNHSYNFVDPDTGAHTQHIERLWREVRSNVPRYGNTKHHFVGHLAEFMFKRKYPTYSERVHHIFRAISQVYNPDRPRDNTGDENTSDDSTDADVEDY